MSAKPTRQAYMSGAVTHAEFYRSVYQAAGVKIYPAEHIIERTKRALARGDEHLNTIPIYEWDMLAARYKTALASSLKAHSDFWSLAGGVCAMKQAAIDAAKI